MKLEMARVTPRQQAVATDFTSSLVEGEMKSLFAYWATQKGVPPEFDGLLAEGRNAIGRV
jgi:hypothetical protein